VDACCRSTPALEVSKKQRIFYDPFMHALGTGIIETKPSTLFLQQLISEIEAQTSVMRSGKGTSELST
jgi:hypothetical protein